MALANRMLAIKRIKRNHFTNVDWLKIQLFGHPLLCLQGEAPFLLLDCMQNHHDSTARLRVSGNYRVDITKCLWRKIESHGFGSIRLTVTFPKDKIQAAKQYGNV